MAKGFIGREAELALLGKRLDRVRTAGEGVAVALRGRRQVGKSRLVQEHCDRANVPYFYFTATKGMSAVESVDRFCAELKESSLVTEPEAVPVPRQGSWTDALRVLAAALPEAPCIVVIDELPWLAEQDGAFDGTLQAAWDRLLSRRPVLLLLLGSDLHMMERLTSYDRPFFGRADNIVLGPLNPAEVAQAAGLPPADALDAHLVTGGLPGIVRSWPSGMPALEFLDEECADPGAPVFSVPESVLLAEFPTPDQARRVLEAIGSGDRTHANIAAAAGGSRGPLASGSLSPLLDRLVREKRVIARDEPLATERGKPPLYRVADSNLRLYLAMLRTAQEHGRRGHPETAARLVRRRWTSWRGRAIEPLIRQSLEHASLAGHTPWPDVEVVGGWWNRRFDPEIDLVGADRGPVASQVSFVGSVKWIGSTFDSRDLGKLTSDARQVPGFDPDRTGLVVVSLSGVAPGVADLDLVWSAGEVVSAWAA